MAGQSTVAGDMPDGLVVHSTIRLDTAEGPREIQLCFGDITLLRAQDKVDVLMLSAFQGDYTPTRTSLIGALYYNRLGLKVGELARNKKEDMRQHFYCWLSHPLPEHLPYRQILCFETPWTRMRSFRHPAELVSDVFRCLVPIFENQEKSVISPLLATGDQNFNRKVMLEAMLDAAINWIRAGLPMKCLKIVIYTRSARKLSQEEQTLVAAFEKMQRKVEQFQAQQKPEKTDVKYDVYMTYNKEDEQEVSRVRDHMLKERADLSIFCQQQYLDSTAAFQSDIMDTMNISRRIVTFLSPAFLESNVCVEQYNIALCCNRKSKQNMLAPFYIETIANMPTYMTLVQYIDVRSRDGTDTRLLAGVKMFVVTLAVVSRHSLLKSISIQYDVFISYSHANTEKARRVLDVLHKLDPNLNIFFDKNELKTGSSWQQTLYTALDNTKVMVTLLSPAYLSSQVCTEEFNLALCRHFSQDEDSGLELIPVLIEPVDSIPRAYSHVPIIDGVEYFDKSTAIIMTAIVKYRTSGERNLRVFHDQEESFELDDILENHREVDFNKRYEIHEGKLQCKALNEDKLIFDADQHRQTDEHKAKIKAIQDEEEDDKLAKELTEKKFLEGYTEIPESEEETPSEKDARKPTYDLNRKYDVAFVCADPAHGYVINTLLFERAPHFSTNFNVKSEEAEFVALDNARLCVVLLSPTMASTLKDVEEFHVALARHRKSTGQPVLYPIIVKPLSQWPTYLHLVPSRISINDRFWYEMAEGRGLESTVSLPKDVLRLMPKVKESFQTVLAAGTLLALSAATDDIISILQHPQELSENEKLIVLHNIVGLTLDNKQPGKDLGEQKVPIEKVLRNLERTNKNGDRSPGTTCRRKEDAQNETGSAAAAASILLRRHGAEPNDGRGNRNQRSQSCHLL